MSTHFLRTATLLALTLCSALALADAPARVGRISLAEGQVSISGAGSGEAVAALLNWPVTSRNQVVTGRDGRAELRVGSTALQLDADSALEVTELDDDNLRLRLHYGSVSVRIRNQEILRGFELGTPQGRVRMQDEGRWRVDAERMPDTTVVTAFAGAARVEGGGATLTLQAGRRAEIHNDDMRTSAALGNSFDDWALQRDRRDERAGADRYVSLETTGYEDLDRNGNWRDSGEYGPLWVPRTVPAGWAPYRDGRWAWIEPWGWTWVDNAPWGYAPFHYGRWVWVDRRWSWAPGRREARPVWAPALVGWVGGSAWQVQFAERGAAPALGWYPLAPRESFVPAYQASPEHVRRMNMPVRTDREHDRWRGSHRDGLTVVPHEQFGQRGTVVVSGAPKAIVAPGAFNSAAAAIAPVPLAPAAPLRPAETRFGERHDRDRLEREWQARQAWQNNRDRIRPATGLTAPSLPQGVASPAPRAGVVPPGPTPTQPVVTSMQRAIAVPAPTVSAPQPPAPPVPRLLAVPSVSAAAPAQTAPPQSLLARQRNAGQRRQGDPEKHERGEKAEKDGR